MKSFFIILAIASAIVGIIFLIFFIKLKISNRKSAYRVKLNEICYEDEYCDGQDFTYKRTRK